MRECVCVSDREETEEVVSTKRKLKEGDERERGKKEEKKKETKIKETRKEEGAGQTACDDVREEFL